jgi:ATP-binding cassette subfamily F protein uup
MIWIWKPSISWKKRWANIPARCWWSATTAISWTGSPAAEGDGTFTEYAGGYSDMLAQRRGPEEEARKTSRENAAAKVRPARVKTAKMNFSDQHLLGTLPDKIEGLNRTIAALQAELDDPNLYARDRKKFDALAARLAEARQAKAADEELWLGLELKREEIEGGT